MKNLLRSTFTTSKPIATVAINFNAVKGPWGGASVFIWQLKEVLEQCGITVRFNLKQHVDLILMIDPREDLQRTAFGLNEIRMYKYANPDVRVIHRINECDARKDSDFMDDALEKGNEVADYTVFISQWLREYFVERWFDSGKPHSVIYNGADPSIFHPIKSNTYVKGNTLRLVTHHWSDNVLKGFDYYQKIDDLIYNGEIEGFEFWVIGRWPENIVWRSARTFPPCSGKKLAELLRQCHLYVTASRWEPCGMHHVEGAQCGLPLLSHVDGGGIVEATEKYGLIFEDDMKDVLYQAKNSYESLRERTLEKMPSGYRMNADYLQIIQMLLAQNAHN